MFKRLLSYVLALGVAATAVFVPVTVSAEYTEVDEAVYDQYPQEFTPLDISGVANMAFADDVADDNVGGWSDQGEINDMREFTQYGEQWFGGVKYNIIDPAKNNGKAIITLRGQGKEGIINHAEIPVGKKGAGIYFLHASAFVQTNIATYTLVYEDGSKYEQPIRNNIENFNFWGANSSDVAWAAWTGANKSTTACSIFMYVMANPYPDKTIEKIVCETPGDGAFNMIVAATLTDSGPYKMIEIDRGNPDTSDWIRYDGYVRGTLRGTALDMTQYVTADAPSGKRGWMKADGDRLVFDDGTEARLWGADTSCSEMFRSHEEIDEKLEEVASWGFNLLRLHKYGQTNKSHTNIYKSSSGKDHFDNQRVDQLCYMVAKMKELGMYLLLDLKVTGASNEDMNVRKDVSESSGWLGGEDTTQRDINFVKELMNTYNPYTGMTLGEDPTICMVDFKNENSGMNLTRDNVRGIGDEIRVRFNNWLIEKYGTTEELRKAWTYTGKDLLKEGENLEDKTVELQYSGERSNATRPRSEDSTNFICDSMIEYSRRINDTLDECGYKGLRTPTTIWGQEYAALMYVLTSGESDYVDTHDYWSHPSGENALHGNVQIGWNAPISMLETNSFGYMGKIFNQNIYDMPHTITEWDECDLNPTMSEGFPFMAIFSAYQNWVPMAFTASMESTQYMILDDTGSRQLLGNNYWAGDPSVPDGFWNYGSHPVKMAVGPASALLFLRGDVTPAQSGFYHRNRINDYFNANNSDLPKNIELGLTGKTGISYDQRAYDPEYNDNDILYKGYMAQKNGIPYVSDTGEIRTDMVNASLELNTEKTQAVIGRLDGKRFETDDMIVEVKDNPFATMMLSAVDDKPIWQADRLLVTAVGDYRGTAEERSRDGMSIIKGGQFPVLIEQILGKLTIKTKDDVTVYALDQAGRRTKTLTYDRDENGWVVIDMTIDNYCTNYEIVRNSAVEGAEANEHIVYDQIEVKDVFTDMDGYEWAKDKIERNFLWGTMSGVSETEFRPGNSITKGDFANVVYKATKLSGTTSEMFEDVATDDPNFNAIRILKANGVVNGDENGNFNPNATISRQDALTMFWRAIKVGGCAYTDKKGGELTKFKDGGDIAVYAKTGVENMMAQSYVNDLFSGISFNPEAPLTRVEAGCLAYGLLWE